MTNIVWNIYIIKIKWNNYFNHIRRVLVAVTLHWTYNQGSSFEFASFTNVEQWRKCSCSRSTPHTEHTHTYMHGSLPVISRIW